MNKWLYHVHGGDVQYWKGIGSLWRGFMCHAGAPLSEIKHVRILQVSAEQCGLSELVTDSLNGPEAPKCTPSQDVLGCTSGTLQHKFPFFS